MMEGKIRIPENGSRVVSVLNSPYVRRRGLLGSRHVFEKNHPGPGAQWTLPRTRFVEVELHYPKSSNYHGFQIMYQ